MDINPGRASSKIDYIKFLNGALYFAAELAQDRYVSLPEAS